MMYLCQLGQNLVIGSEDRAQKSPFLELYDPGDLGNKIKVTIIYKFLMVLLLMYLCQFSQNLVIGSEDRVQTKLFLIFI